MKPEADDQQQPFLGFRDDPTKRDSEEDEEQANVENGNPHRRQQTLKKASRTRRYLRDFLVFLATSLVWVVALSFFMPGPECTTDKPNTSSPSPGRLPVVVGQDGKGGANMPGTFSGMATAPAHNITSNAKFVSCGNSTQEAKKNGCKYDTLLNHWVPSQCQDKEWETEYLDDDSWTAYADKNLTERLTREAMGDRVSYYTSIRDHVNHCSMLWKKQFWTIFEDRPIFDAVIVNSYHTEHCADFLKELYGMNRTEPTFVKVGFSGCWVRKGSDEL